MVKVKIREIILEIQKVISDKQRKPILIIFYELLKYWAINKDFPKYYHKNMLHRNDGKNYLDYYIGKKEYRNIRLLMKDKELASFLENKVLFHKHFKDSNIRLPDTLGYNIGNIFFSQNGSTSINDLDSFSRLIKDLIAKAGSNSIFMKPISGGGGRDCFKIDAHMLNSDYLARVYKKISPGKYLFQETLIQHPLISNVYPHSINTLRIHACMYNSGQIDLVSTYMRFGSDGNFVEGGGLGTIYIDVDMESGSLGTCARKNFEYGGDTYTSHPDTGYEFAGFVVPRFAEALETAKSATAFLPYRLVGWDIAITEEGPVLIEGNHFFGFFGAQIADGGYRKNNVFKSFYEELTANKQE